MVIKTKFQAPRNLIGCDYANKMQKLTQRLIIEEKKKKNQEALLIKTYSRKCDNGGLSITMAEMEAGR